MSIGVSINVNINDTIKDIKELKKQIMWAMPGAINNSLRKVQDTIYTDYRRTGNAISSTENPSRSGLGFTDRTGSLRASISYNTKISSTKVVGTLSAKTDYAIFVEQLWGGRYSYMLPALNQNTNYIIDQVVEAIRRAIARTAK